MAKRSSTRLFQCNPNGGEAENVSCIIRPSSRDELVGLLMAIVIRIDGPVIHSHDKLQVEGLDDAIAPVPKEQSDHGIQPGRDRAL